jgi:hypothetical protein
VGVGEVAGSVEEVVGGGEEGEVGEERLELGRRLGSLEGQASVAMCIARAARTFG